MTVFGKRVQTPPLMQVLRRVFKAIRVSISTVVDKTRNSSSMSAARASAEANACQVSSVTSTSMIRSSTSSTTHPSTVIVSSTTAVSAHCCNDEVQSGGQFNFPRRDATLSGVPPTLSSATDASTINSSATVATAHRFGDATAATVTQAAHFVNPHARAPTRLARLMVARDDNTTVAVMVSMDSTVLELKSLLSLARLAPAPLCFWLSFNGAALADARRLCSYNISDDLRVQIRLRVRGGAKTKATTTPATSATARATAPATSATAPRATPPAATTRPAQRSYAAVVASALRTDFNLNIQVPQSPLALQFGDLYGARINSIGDFARNTIDNAITTLMTSVPTVQALRHGQASATMFFLQRDEAIAAALTISAHDERGRRPLFAEYSGPRGTTSFICLSAHLHDAASIRRISDSVGRAVPGATVADVATDNASRRGNRTVQGGLMRLFITGASALNYIVVSDGFGDVMLLGRAGLRGRLSSLDEAVVQQRVRVDPCAAVRNTISIIVPNVNVADLEPRSGPTTPAPTPAPTPVNSPATVALPTTASAPSTPMPVSAAASATAVPPSTPMPVSAAVTASPTVPLCAPTPPVAATTSTAPAGKAKVTTSTTSKTATMAKPTPTQSTLPFALPASSTMTTTTAATVLTSVNATMVNRRRRRRASQKAAADASTPITSTSGGDDASVSSSSSSSSSSSPSSRSSSDDDEAPAPTTALSSNETARVGEASNLVTATPLLAARDAVTTSPPASGAATHVGEVTTATPSIATAVDAPLPVVIDAPVVTTSTEAACVGEAPSVASVASTHIGDVVTTATPISAVDALPAIVTPTAVDVTTTPATMTAATCVRMPAAPTVTTTLQHSNATAWRQLAGTSSAVMIEQQSALRVALRKCTDDIGDDDVDDTSERAIAKSSVLDELRRVTRVIDTRSAARDAVGHDNLLHIATVPDGNCCYASLFVVLSSLSKLPNDITTVSLLKAWLMKSALTVDASTLARLMAGVDDTANVEKSIVDDDLTLARGGNASGDVNILHVCACALDVSLRVTIVGKTPAGVVSTHDYKIGAASSVGRLILYDRHFDACVDVSLTHLTTPPSVDSVHEAFSVVDTLEPPHAPAVRVAATAAPVAASLARTSARIRNARRNERALSGN